MNKEQTIRRLIELAESLDQSAQEKLACIAQGMVAASTVPTERKQNNHNHTSDTKSA